MSSASPAMAAGRTMSAYFAVSVRKCSATTVNRSSRCRPFDDLVGLGRLAHRIGAVHEQALDRRIELHLAGQRLAELEIVDDARAGLDPVGRATRFTQSTGNSHSGICSRPPPTCRHEPASAGSAHTARIAWPPPACRSSATPMRMTEGCAVANSRANVRCRRL